MPIKPTPFECYKNCTSFVHTTWNGMLLSVCGECALRIQSLIDCPKTNPYIALPLKDRKTRGGWSQSRAAMKREIAKSEMLSAVRAGNVTSNASERKETYQQKITRLSGEYGKKKRSKK